MFEGERGGTLPLFWREASFEDSLLERLGGRNLFGGGRAQEVQLGGNFTIKKKKLPGPNVLQQTAPPLEALKGLKRPD